MAYLHSAQGRARAHTVPGNSCASNEIREIGVCGSLEASELDELSRIVTSSDCIAGKTVFAEGEPAENLYSVISGSVRLTKLLPDGRRQITGFMFPGDFLGIAFNAIYAYSAEAIEPTRLCRFPRQAMERLVHAIRNLEHGLLGEAAAELAAAQDQMLLLGRKTAQERVASFLLGLIARARRRGRDENPVALPMSRTDIADYLGLTTETVSRCFTKLKTARVIQLMQPGSVVVVEPARLAFLAQGGYLREH